MSTIIDRRLNPKGKSINNRQKFLKRVKNQIKETVRKSISGKDIKDIGTNEKVNIKNKDISEPTFNHDPLTGNSKRVMPGNKEFESGDKLPKPKGGAGKGGKGEGDGEAEDGLEEFQFTLTKEEFLQYLFEDLELPDFIKQSMEGAFSEKVAREGFTNHSSPANLNIGQTFRKSIGRRLALHRPSDQDIQDLRDKIEEGERKGNVDPSLYDELERLLGKQKTIPFIDENDLRYNLWTKHPVPISKAVMFMLMDVSGSMGEFEKDIAKRFFLLLYLFIEKKYDVIDLRFIRHTTTAQEVDEHTFFYDPIMGGTVISTGIELILDIIKKEYDPAQWNIYVSQATDGDNYYQDNPIVEGLIANQLLPLIQYYAYIQIGDMPNMHNEWSSWWTFDRMSKQHKKIQAKIVEDKTEVWSVFHELFSKDKQHG